MRKITRLFKGENQFGPFFGIVLGAKLVGNKLWKSEVVYVDEEVYEQLAEGMEIELK